MLSRRLPDRRNAISLQFSQAVGLDGPFVLAGHSMGGHICWRFALGYPGRLEAGLKGNVIDLALLTCEMVEEWWRASRRAGVLRASVARLRAPFAEPAVIARLGKIRTRTLIQWGELDNVFPLELGEHMARRIPNSQFLTYACCRHIPILEHPDRTADDADAFMDSR